MYGDRLALITRETDPWHEVSEIERMLGNWWADDEAVWPVGFPAVNLKTDDDKAELSVELPGVELKDIEISVKGSHVIIKGERKAPELKEHERYHRRERWYGKFERVIMLPFSADSSKVDAKFINGVLLVTLPKAEAEKPRKIEIRHA